MATHVRLAASQSTPRRARHGSSCGGWIMRHAWVLIVVCVLVGVGRAEEREESSTLCVVDAAGHPVVGAACEVWEDWQMGASRRMSEQVVKGKTDQEGRLAIPALDAAGRFRLVVTPPVSREDLAALELDPWTPLALTVTLPEAYTVTVTVRDDHGPLQGATVLWREPDPRPWSPQEPHEVGITDDQGTVVVRGLPKGAPREISAFLRGEEGIHPFPGCTPWVAADPTRRTMKLRIPTIGHRLTVRADGARTGQRGILALEDAGGEYGGTRRFTFGEGGVAHVEDVGDGEYVLLVLATGEEEADDLAADDLAGRVGPFRFAGGDVSVPLVPKASLRVRLVAPASAKHLGAFVMLFGNAVRLEKGKNGLYLLDHLPPGPYDVVGYGMLGDKMLHGRTRAKTGATTALELATD